MKREKEKERIKVIDLTVSYFTIILVLEKETFIKVDFPILKLKRRTLEKSQAQRTFYRLLNS